MENEKLNNLVLEYQSTNDELVFNEIYRELISDNRNFYNKVAASIGCYAEDVVELYQDILMYCLRKFPGNGNFRYYFSSSIKREKWKLQKRVNRKKANEFFYEELTKDNGESEAETFEIADDFNLAEEVTEIKEADQRQLIDFLTKDSDAKTTAIVEAFLRRPDSNALAIEKELGLKRHTVKRTLEKLAGKFDSQTFGNHTDYLVAL